MKTLCFPGVMTGVLTVPLTILDILNVLSVLRVVTGMLLLRVRVGVGVGVA